MRPGSIVIVLPSLSWETSKLGMIVCKKKLELTTFYDVFIPADGGVRTVHQMYVQTIDD
jgi:hypothetical protein